jgi:site-specific DNA-methyltransferase (adenine-specific)
MTKPHYADESVTLYHGRCEDVLPTIDPASVNVLLTDPPYFEVKDDEWDHQWDHAAEFLTWLGGVLDTAKPLLTANASAWVFAGPALASQVEGVVRERFRVLNQVRWVKEQGWHQKAEIAAQRRYLTPWEAIVFAEQHSESARGKQLDEAKGAWASIGSTLSRARLDASLTREQVAAAFADGHVNLAGAKARVSAWEIGNERIARHAHAALASLCDVPDFDSLAAEYDAADEVRREELRATRRPFHLARAAGPVSDVWNFDTVAPYAGKHPCEKPQALLRHIIDVSSRPGDLILDPFAGSGSTLIAARDAGRRAIGIEQDLGYCRRIADRLSQGVLDFGETA